MQSNKRSVYPSWADSPLSGAALAAGLAFAYAFVFVVYATIRSSLLVVSNKPDASVLGTIVAYFFTLVVPALVIATMMAVPASLIGLVTAPILKHVVLFLNPQRSERRAIGIGSATCFAISGVLLIALQRLFGFTIGDAAANPETFLLWLGLPALIFIAAGGFAGREINRVANRASQRKEQTQPATAGGANLSAV